MLGLSITIGAFAIMFCARLVSHHAARAHHNDRLIKHALLVSYIATALAFVLLFIMALWATLFVLLGVFATFEEALYIAMISATTLGYGDGTVPEDWRLLAGFIATSGFMLFGLDTAFLFEVLRQIAKEATEEG